MLMQNVKTVIIVLQMKSLRVYKVKCMYIVILQDMVNLCVECFSEEA